MQVSTPSSSRMTENIAAMTCVPACIVAKISCVNRPPVLPLQYDSLLYLLGNPEEVIISHLCVY